MLAKKPENIYYAVIMQQTSHHSYSRLVDGYNHMMASIREAFADKKLKKMSLNWALQIASEAVVRGCDITPNEAVEIGELIKRDVNDAAEFLMETSVEFSDWLLLDIDIVERRMVEHFLSITEKARFEITRLYDHNPKPSLY